MKFDEINLPSEFSLLKIQLFHLREIIYNEAVEGQKATVSQIRIEVTQIVLEYFNIASLEDLPKDIYKEIVEKIKMFSHVIYEEISFGSLSRREYLDSEFDSLDDDLRPVYLDNRQYDYLNEDDDSQDIEL